MHMAGQGRLGGNSVLQRAPAPPIQPTKNSLKLNTLTRGKPCLKNENVMALESLLPTSNKLNGMYIYNQLLPLIDLDVLQPLKYHN